MANRDDLPSGIRSEAKSIHEAAVSSSEWQPYNVNKLNALAEQILTIGINYKKRTEELDAKIYKQIDKWDYNNKTFKLKCNYPCSDCKDDDPNYCLHCWGIIESEGYENKNYFLQPLKVQTCKPQCDNKFTVNGPEGIVKIPWKNDLFTKGSPDNQMTYYKCRDCEYSCATCAGQQNLNALKTGPSEANDQIRCTSCGGDIGYFF